MHPPHQPKRNESGRKITPNFGENLFFFFFFWEHLILGEKIVWISDFGQKTTLNFGEDIRIFAVLCLKSPPTKIFWSATGDEPSELLTHFGVTQQNSKRFDYNNLKLILFEWD